MIWDHRFILDVVRLGRKGAGENDPEAGRGMPDHQVPLEFVNL